MSTFYAEPGVLTRIDASQRYLLAGVPDDPVGLCRVAQGLVIQPYDATAAGLPDARLAERQIRPAAEMLRVLTKHSSAPLREARPPATRIVGSCRHFATLACALLRARGIPARARCGFGGYFVADRYVDHWVNEYWDGGRWIRIDTEHLGGPQPVRHEDLDVGDFLTGGEAWQRCRNGDLDPMHFGIAFHPTNWGPGEVRANAIRDLAAVRKLEMLPWDEWGRMVESFEGRTGPDFDAVIDEIAAVTATDDLTAEESLYKSGDLAVPDALIY